MADGLSKYISAENISLKDISEGETLFITKINVGNFAHRLNDLGIGEASEIKKLFSPPWGDPCAYLFKGSVIALRGETARGIRGIRKGAEKWKK